MRKIISFCLWGDKPKYTIGAIKNVKLALEIYPDWICRFYVATSVPKLIVRQLKAFNNVEIIEKNEEGDWRGMLWRCDAGHDGDYDVVIFRDTDCRLNTREKAAVDAWVASDRNFHVMRDHPYHQALILGGMWGMKSPRKEWIKGKLDEFRKSDAYQDVYGFDYTFLGNMFSEIYFDIMFHDPFFAKIDFPTKREGLEFVGMGYYGNDEYPMYHTNGLRDYLKHEVL